MTQEDSQGPVSKALASPAIVIVGTVADFAAVAIILSGDSVLIWVREHPRATVLVVAFLVLLVVGLLNAWLWTRGIARKRSADLMLLREQAGEPSAQDLKRYAEFVEDFGLDSALYRWIKDNFLVDKAMYRQLSALDKVADKWRRDPTNFHDALLRDSFEKLRKAVFNLRDVTVRYYYSPDDGPSTEPNSRFAIPWEWEHKDRDQWDEAIRAIESAHDEIMESYEDFMNLAHSRRVTLR